MKSNLDKYSEYLAQYHPQIWKHLVEQEALRAKVYKVLSEYLQQSAPQLSDDDDLHLLGAFGTDDSTLEQLIEQVHAAGS
jgi:hypothetical protein